jgi:hypothetical protein
MPPVGPFRPVFSAFFVFGCCCRGSSALKKGAVIYKAPVWGCVFFGPPQAKLFTSVFCFANHVAFLFSVIFACSARLITVKLKLITYNISSSFY